MNTLEQTFQQTFQGMQPGANELPKRWAFRQGAFDKLSHLGMPTRKDDHWRYSGLHHDLFKSFEPQTDTFDASLIEHFFNVPLFQAERPYMALCYNGQLIQNTAQDEFEFHTLNTLPKTQTAGLMSFFEPQWLDSYSQMSLLNQSFAKDGLFLHIPANTELAHPIYLFHLAKDDHHPTMVHPQNYIVVGANSKVQIVECYVCDGQAKILQNALTHIQVAKDAHLEHIVLQHATAEQIQVATLHVEQETNSRTEIHLHPHGQFVNRIELNCGLMGRDAQSEVYGLEYTREHMVNDIHLNMEHIAPHCDSKIHIKNVANDNSRAALTGRIKVHPHASKTNADLQNQGLLLSLGAEIDARPQLEIYHDDVKCAHGSAIGALCEDSLFYLRQRGIDLEAAKWMLIQGFIQQIIDKLPNIDVKSFLEDRLEART